MRFEVIFDTGEELANAEYEAIDWQDVIAHLESSGILTQVKEIKLLPPRYAPPARDMDDIPF